MDLSVDWRFLPRLLRRSPALPPQPPGPSPLLPSPAARHAPHHPPLPLPLPLPAPPTPPQADTTDHLLRDILLPDSSHLHSLSGSGGLTTTPPPSPSTNLLAAISADSRSLILFFPSGDNADHVSSVTLHRHSMDEGISTSTTSLQADGFVHPGQRILHLAATCSDDFCSWTPPPAGAGAGQAAHAHGFLLAATLRSVSWFKVVASSSPAALVPAAKQAFDAAVVHACWSKHLQSDCLVLLETGQLCCLDLDTLRGSNIKLLHLGSKEEEAAADAWLSCDYGPQPWTAIVASTKAILLVDLRLGDHGEHKVIARVGMEGLFQSLPKSINDKASRYLAFCKAPFDQFLVSVLTERRLMVLDIRKPMTPVLTWQHGLDHPNHVAMFRLSQLRHCQEHEWASNSGIAILAGSFLGTDFSLFCCGPKEQGNPDHLYAWGLPSRISLTGQHCGCAKGIMHQVFDEPIPGHASAPQQSRNSIVGYQLLPNAMLDPSFTGFGLVRLTSSGTLEMQRFRAYGDSDVDDVVRDDESHHKSMVSSPSVSLDTQGENFSSRHMFLKFHYLSKYLEGNLRGVLENHDSSASKHSRQIVIGDDVSAFAKDNSTPCYRSASDFLRNASVPMNIFEVACQSSLNRLSSDTLLVTFSNYSDMLQCTKEERMYEYLEVPACSPNKNKPRPFLLAKASTTGQKLTAKVVSKNALVPVLPIPVVLAMEDSNKGSDSTSQGQRETSSMSHQCREVVEAIAPEISTANADKLSASQRLKPAKPYFVYKPQIDTNRPTVDETARKKGKQVHMPDFASCLHTSMAPHMDDENFTTFVCGRTGSPHSGKEKATSDPFDFGPVMMDFELPAIDIPPSERKMLNLLKKQFVSWHNNFKPYQDFCNSHQIQKTPAARDRRFGHNVQRRRP
uniref:Uncharacterized protein n=1 Tax=Oryza brachyantha TaxID=4533 RepID=J3MVJ1_ORYBR